MIEEVELQGKLGDDVVRVVVWMRKIDCSISETSEPNIAYEYGVRAICGEKRIERTRVCRRGHPRLISLRDAGDLVHLAQIQGVDHDQMLKDLGGELRLMPAVIYRCILLFVHLYVEITDQETGFLVTVSFPDLEATNAISQPVNVDLFCDEVQLNDFGRAMQALYELADQHFYPADLS